MIKDVIMRHMLQQGQDCSTTILARLRSTMATAAATSAHKKHPIPMIIDQKHALLFLADVGGRPHRYEKQ
jgi:hypothetical protein